MKPAAPLTLPRITLGRLDESRQSFDVSLSGGWRYWSPLSYVREILGSPVEARSERSSIGRMPVGSIRGRLVTRPSPEGFSAPTMMANQREPEVEGVSVNRGQRLGPLGGGRERVIAPDRICPESTKV